MTRKRAFYALAFALYLLVLVLAYFTKIFPRLTFQILVLPLALALAVLPMVIVAVIVFKILDRRRKP